MGCTATLNDCARGHNPPTGAGVDWTGWCSAEKTGAIASYQKLEGRRASMEGEGPHILVRAGTATPGWPGTAPLGMARKASPKLAMMGRAHATPPEGGRHATFGCGLRMRRTPRGDDLHLQRQKQKSDHLLLLRKSIHGANLMSSQASAVSRAPPPKSVRRPSALQISW
jgi:hypothetical protein